MSATRSEYAVTAKRWAQGWELHIEGVGVTQSDTLDDAEFMARDLIVRREGVPAGSFKVVITTELDGEQVGRRTAAFIAGIESRPARGLRGAFAAAWDVVSATALPSHSRGRGRAHGRGEVRARR